MRRPEYDTTIQFVVAVDGPLLAHLAGGSLRLQLRAAGDHALLAVARVPLRPLVEAAPVGLGASAARHRVDLLDARGRCVVRPAPARLLVDCARALPMLEGGVADLVMRHVPGTSAQAAGFAQGALACGAALLRPLAFALRAHLAGGRARGPAPAAAASDDAAPDAGSSAGGRTADERSAGSAGSARVRVRRQPRSLARADRYAANGSCGDGAGQAQGPAPQDSEDGPRLHSANGAAEAADMIAEADTAHALDNAEEKRSSARGDVAAAAERIWRDVAPDGQVRGLCKQPCNASGTTLCQAGSFQHGPCLPQLSAPLSIKATSMLCSAYCAGYFSYCAGYVSQNAKVSCRAGRTTRRMWWWLWRRCSWRRARWPAWAPARPCL